MKRIYLNTLAPEEIIKRLKNGEVVHIDGSDSNTFKMIDGVVCSCYNGKPYCIGVGLDVEDDDYFFEDAEPFKIEKTGKFKTRDGRIAFVAVVNDDYCYGMICGDAGSKMWRIDGKWTSSEDTENDLVEYIGD